MYGKTRFMTLVAIMATVALSSAITAGKVLYDAAFDQERHRLIELANFQSGIINTILEHENEKLDDYTDSEIRNILLDQVSESHRYFAEHTFNGEFELAQLHSDGVEYFLRHKHEGDNFGERTIIPAKMEWAEPMRRALAGESGSMIVRDQRGEAVLSAYSTAEALGWGIVFKKKIADIRKPFIKAGIAGVFVIVILTLVGTFFFQRVFEPINRKIRESEERFRSVTQSANDAIITTDQRGLITTWNKGAISIFGYSEAEMLGAPVTRIIPKHIHSAHQKAIDGLVNEKTTLLPGKTVEHWACGKDGKEFPIELSLSKWNLGDETFFTGIIRDINERKKMENFLRTVAEGVSGNVGETFFVTLVKYLAKTLEVEFALVGKLKPDDPESISTVAVSADGKHIENFEYSIAHTPCENVVSQNLCVYEQGVSDLFPKDDFLREMGISGYVGAPLIDSSERPLGILAIMSRNPITQPKEVISLFKIFAIRAAAEMERESTLEDLRKAKEDAEKANETKSEFMASMSHELRTPLNAIIGFSDMISNQYFGSIGEPKYLEYSKDIGHSGRHLLGLINQVLDIERIEASKYTFTIENIDIDEMFNECEMMFHKQANDKNITLSFLTPKKLPPLFADKRAIFQVLINLIANSVKFTPEGGCVSVEARLSQRQYIFEVKDTGIGIPLEKLPTIKNAFTRHENDPHKPQEGVGLGLAIANGLVALHGGILNINSQEKAGTTVTMELPIAAT